MSRVLGFALACCLALALPTDSALAKGHLDTSFGDHGIMSLDPEGDPEDITVGPHGEIFVIEKEPLCFRAGCPQQVHLKRYRADGTLDRNFGGGRILVGTMDDWFDAALAVDSAGRPLVVLKREKQLVIRRFRPGGRPDRSFGESGTGYVPCSSCTLSGLEVAPGGSPLLSASEFKRTSRFRGAILVIVRLRTDGSPDRNFARNGLLRRRVPGYSAMQIRSDGGMYLFGTYCCRITGPPFAQRMSESGRLQRRYAAATRHSLRGLYGTGRDDVTWWRMMLVQQPDGEVELFGGRTGPHALAVKLQADGSRDASFGRSGVKKLGFELTGVTADGFGGTFLVGYVYGPRSRSGYKVMRLLPDGSIDPSFGRVDLPGADNEEGVWIVSQGRGAAIVYDPGLPWCREACEADPKMYRVVESRR